jgi:FAD/FMN-containing dehydrogenase
VSDVLAPTVLDDLSRALPPNALRVGAEVEERYRGDWVVRSGPADAPLALTLPRTTADVSAIMRICHAHRTPVVAQGGLTGLTGAGTPSAGAVLISLERMRAIEEVDPVAATMTVEAGVTLQAVQEAADAADLLYPLDIGDAAPARSAATSRTNAGGNRVLRYGMTRDLVLGLEVVLADGTVMTSLNKMLKNNTAYDLKHLFIGAEGTLGIVTRAVLKLYPKPLGTDTALCAFRDFDAVYAFLRRARAKLAGSLTAFELMWPSFYAHAIAGRSGAPLSAGHAAYVLIESMGTDPERDQAHFADFIEGALSDDLVVDAVLAKSIAQARELWSIRDMSGELVRTLQPLANFDVSIETGKIDAFERALQEQLRARWPSAQTICFGHLADSNLHMFVKVDEAPFPERAIDDLVYSCVRDWGGSISAEHGIGLIKKPYLSYSRTPEELALMRVVKAALDPHGILNPARSSRGGDRRQGFLRARAMAQLTRPLASLARGTRAGNFEPHRF